MHSSSFLSVQNLHVAVEKKEILYGISFHINGGERVAFMGPNGSGKSTLAYTLMGHPRFSVTEGSVLFSGEDMLALSPDERARKGLFLSFQYPEAIPGVPFAQFLRQAYEARTGSSISAKEFFALLEKYRALLHMDAALLHRSLNDGFSGGEKKRAEILQLAVLHPTVAILDETDSGLDIDALKSVAEGIQAVQREHPDMAVLVITHYERFLEFLEPNRVLVMKQGNIVAEGGKELADRIQREGYEAIG